MDEYTGIDFVEMYQKELAKESEYEKADTMLKAAAVLVDGADRILTVEEEDE